MNYRHACGFPRWMHRVLVTGATLLSMCSPVRAGVVTIPPGSRAEQLCQALGTEAPCDTEEIGHVRGTLTFVAQDAASGLLLHGVLVARSKTHATSLPTYGAGDEVEVVARVNDPQTRWASLVADSRTWPTLRALAKVDEGVPVLVTAVARKGGVDASSDPAMASTAIIRVRFALVRLR